MKGLLEGQVDANDFVNQHPAEAQKPANDQIEKITGKRLADPVVAAAVDEPDLHQRPVASSLQSRPTTPRPSGLLETVDLTGIYDLTLLNEVLKAARPAEVSGL